MVHLYHDHEQTQKTQKKKKIMRKNIIYRVHSSQKAQHPMENKQKKKIQKIKIILICMEFVNIHWRNKGIWCI